ncbi:MAG TPA: DUF2157 domain-containing protein, partial [Armatimonadota bacterium]|nr:DUF2157 domain-containing protein [Armatimonadota bacterium]
LTGRPPFRDTSAEKVLSMVLTDRPLPVLQLERRVAPELAAICERAMAWNREDRHASAKELAGDLQTFISGRVFTEREAKRSFVSAIYVFGVTLLVTGTGILAYCCWEDIPPSIRVLVLFAAVATLYVCGARSDVRRVRKRQRAEALTLLGTLMLGITIFLTAQVYDLAGLMRHGFGLWAAGTMAIAYATRSKANGFIAMFAAWAWFFQETRQIAPADLWWFPPLAAAVTLPFAYAQDSPSTFVATLLLFSSTTAYVTHDNGVILRLCLSVAACAALFFPLGLLSYASERRRKFAAPAITLAVVFLAATLLPLGSMKASQLLAVEVIPTRRIEPTQLLPVGLVCAAAIFMWCLAAARRFVWPKFHMLVIAFLTATALFAVAAAVEGTAAPGDGNGNPHAEWAGFVIATAAALTLGIGVAWTGVLLEDRRVFNLGTFLNVLVTVHCAVEMNVSLAVKAAMMLAAGIIVIFAGRRVESHHKRRGLL